MRARLTSYLRVVTRSTKGRPDLTRLPPTCVTSELLSRLDTPSSARQESVKRYPVGDAHRGQAVDRLVRCERSQVRFLSRWLVWWVQNARAGSCWRSGEIPHAHHNDRWQSSSRTGGRAHRDRPAGPETEWRLFRGQSLVGTDLSDSVLNGADLEDADLSAARIAGAAMQGVHCHGAKFDGADAQGVDLYWAGAFQASFRGADLTGADLRGDFKEADFTGANLSDANFSRDNLSGSTCRQGADFSGADLRGAKFEGARYDSNPRFPAGFEPKTKGMVLVDENGRNV